MRSVQAQHQQIYIYLHLRGQHSANIVPLRPVPGCQASAFKSYLRNIPPTHTPHATRFADNGIFVHGHLGPVQGTSSSNSTSTN